MDMKMTEEKTNNPLSLYDWAGGLKAIEKWITRFYDKVVKDPLLELLFKDMDKEHQKSVALFLAEVFGGPQEYTKKRGGHATMLRHHLDKGISEKQRKRWVDLLLESADEVGMPDDPEFRSAIVSYIEWGTRLAVINSQPGQNPELDDPMPKWGWGEVGGPYQEN